MDDYAWSMRKIVRKNLSSSAHWDCSSRGNRCLPFDTDGVKKCVQNFDFKNLFVNYLGWENYSARTLTIPVDSTNYYLSPLAEKRGVVVFVCETKQNEVFPVYAVRLKIDRQVSRS